MANINNPHDKYFKEFMSDLRIAKDFFRFHLSHKVVQEIDLDSLRLCQESWMDEHLQLLFSDILYKINFKHRDGFIYLLVEHHVKKMQNEYLPVVIPMVFYHGDRVYSHSTDVMTLFGEEESLAEEYLFKPFKLIDLSKHSDEAIATRGWVRLMEYVQKYIFHPDALTCFKDIFPRFVWLKEKGEDRIIATTIKYIVEGAKLDVPERFLELLAKFKINNDGGDDMAQTLAEYWMHEGKAEGAKETKLLVAKNLCAAKLDSSFIAHAIQLPIHEITALRREFAVESAAAELQQ